MKTVSTLEAKTTLQLGRPCTDTCQSISRRSDPLVTPSRASLARSQAVERDTRSETMIQFNWFLGSAGADSASTSGLARGDSRNFLPRYSPNASLVTRSMQTTAPLRARRPGCVGADADDHDQVGGLELDDLHCGGAGGLGATEEGGDEGEGAEERASIHEFGSFRSGRPRPGLGWAPSPRDFWLVRQRTPELQAERQLGPRAGRAGPAPSGRRGRTRAMTNLSRRPLGVLGCAPAPFSSARDKDLACRRRHRAALGAPR